MNFCEQPGRHRCKKLNAQWRLPPTWADDGLLGTTASLARAALLGGVSALAMRCMRGVLCVRLWRSRLALGSVLRFGFCCSVLLVGGFAHGSGGVRFVMTL